MVTTITVHELTKVFGAQTAVDHLSFEVPAGQIVGFLGPNGAGKSTTLKMLTGMLEPSSGAASICGFDLLREPLEVMPGPGSLCDGARRAVLLCLTVPLVIVFGLIAWLVGGESMQLLLLLPGVIALPVYAMVGCLGGKAVPFALPSEEGKSARRGVVMMGSVIIAMVLAGLGTLALTGGLFWGLRLGGTILSPFLY